MKHKKQFATLTENVNSELLVKQGIFRVDKEQ